NLPEDDCPFCVGGLEAPHAYDVRWFPNRWPALDPGPPVDFAAAEGAGATRVPAVGAAEVVLFSPEHTQSLATLPVSPVRTVVDLWAARTAALLARPEVEYVLVFENRGREVGATIDHPHGQIYAYPFEPPVPAREGASAREGSCPICAEVAPGAQRSPRSPRENASSPRQATGWRTCRTPRRMRTGCASPRAHTSGRCRPSTTRAVTTSRTC